ncbi:uncharacterized protein PHA67_012540 isoform 2-T2 [Liasis olivaceus]
MAGPAEASGAARYAKGQYPPTLTMVREAVQVLNERKGSSAVAIKRYIRHNYPGVDPIRLKYYLRKALLKGLEKGYLVRPLNSTAQGATGRFKLAAVKPKPGKVRGARPPQGESSSKSGKEAEGKAPAAEYPRSKGKADAEGKEKASRKKSKAELDQAPTADPMKRKPKEKVAEGKAPKKPRPPEAPQVKATKPPSKAPPKGEAKMATKGKARPKPGMEGEAEPPGAERVKVAKGGQAESRAGAPRPRAKAGKKAAKGKEKKEAVVALGPGNA